MCRWRKQVIVDGARERVQEFHSTLLTQLFLQRILSCQARSHKMNCPQEVGHRSSILEAI